MLGIFCCWCVGSCFGFRPGRGLGGMTHCFDAEGIEGVRGSSEGQVGCTCRVEGGRGLGGGDWEGHEGARGAREVAKFKLVIG